MSAPKPQIQREDLPEIVEEAARLADERAAVMEEAEVRQVLKEIDLPEDLALAANERVLEKQAEARKKKQRFRLLLGAGALGLVLVAGVVSVAQTRAVLVANVESSDARLSVGRDGPDTASFRASDRPDVYLNVTLQNAPTGRALDLRCDFRDPQGKVARQITYTTQPIKTPVWPTHCHYALPSSAPKGDWSVELVLESKTVRKERFRVE